MQYRNNNKKISMCARLWNEIKYIESALTMLNVVKAF